jgi:asparagine synthase (glutamine-hydrolysing)
MCGIAGIFTDAPRSAEELSNDVRRMTDPIAHRGPDDSGEWVDAEAGVALGFRRLAIIDLSEQGHQPMRSGSGRFWIIFNGEIYNYRDIRQELEQAGFRFRGHSDTEVMLGAFEKWGVADATKRFVGMFAFATWDHQRRELTLGRDRLGKKPVYVYSEPGLVTFGSELKTLVNGPSFDRTVDSDAAAAFLRYLYVPGPKTIYTHVVKLPPGHTLTIRDVSKPLPASQPYWSIEEVAARGLANPFTGSDAEAIDETHALIRQAVDQRMFADVPLGAFLSGGIDSSTVVAQMQALSSRPVKTFSIAFDSKEHNEAHHAAAIARHLGTDHTETMLTGADALELVPRLAEMFDEPFADTSQLPAYLVCAVARRAVTVALSGDGGDEVFGGYNRYTYAEQVFDRVSTVPRAARHLIARSIGGVPVASWDRAHQMVSPLLPSRLRQRLPGEKLHKIGRLFGSDSPAEMYRSLLSAWQRPEDLVIGGHDRSKVVERVMDGPLQGGMLDRMMLADQMTYLVEDSLVKVDRVSMATSLEVRVPLLDHRLVEFSWRLPSHMKVRGGEGKWILRQVLYRMVPRELIDRPKMGFSVPLGAWLRGPLREWAEELLTTERLEQDGLLRAAPIRQAWREMLAGRDATPLSLWAVLMLQAWRERWVSAPALAA